jgi:hypothetical protein
MEKSRLNGEMKWNLTSIGKNMDNMEERSIE